MTTNISDICYGCKNSYYDVEEGLNCLKYDSIIELANGQILKWPGQSCDKAYVKYCYGNGFEKGLIPAIVRKHPIIFIIVSSIIFGLSAVAVCLK